MDKGKRKKKQKNKKETPFNSGRPRGYLMAGAAFFEFPVKLELENKLESGPRLRVKARSYEQIIAI